MIPGISSAGSSRKEAKAMGYSINIGPECGFFLFRFDDKGIPTTIGHDQGGYFDFSPVDRGEDARRDIVLPLNEMGFEVEASHHEGAPVSLRDRV